MAVAIFGESDETPVCYRFLREDGRVAYVLEHVVCGAAIPAFAARLNSYGQASSDACAQFTFPAGLAAAAFRAVRARRADISGGGG